jgi:transcription elongation factor GreB
MSRYRPPAAPRTALITPEGYAKLQAELDFLWHKRRPEVTKAVSEAAAMGDRSENAEYIYGKKLLREIDSRVRFLRKRLESLKAISELPSDQSRIFFGAWVSLEDAETGEVLNLRIVGPDETDAKQGWISIDAPMARALLKKQVDDEVFVERPIGKGHFFVLEINYHKC